MTASPLRRLTLLAVSIGAILAIGASSAWAATFNVNKTADTADGTCDSDCSLREAISAANTNVGADTVAVPPGTYHLTIAGTGEDANATGDLDFTDPNGASTTVVGHTARDTIINATGLGDRVFDVHTTGVAISHLTVTGASVDGSGGGIRDLPSTSFTLTDAAVVGNIASGAHTGGGLDVEGSATVNRSLIASNQNSADGGGVDVDGSVSITDSTIANNRVDTSLAPANPSFGAFGGGIEADGTATLTNVTIAGNFITDTTGTPLHGSGSGLSGPASHVTAVNTIVYGNSGSTVTSTANCDHAQTSSGHNVDQDATCFSGGTGDTTSDPLLGTLADNGGETNTMAIGASGSALDTGASGSCSTTDQRGVSRPQGSVCDIGAFELGGILAVTKTADTADGTCDTDCSLREAISAANAGTGLSVVVVPAGHYLLDHTGAGEDANATGDLDVLGAIELRGAGARTTTIDGDASDRVFHILPGAALDASGVTITNGKVPNNAGGAGIFNRGALTLTDATVSGNSAGDSSACGTTVGGGIANNAQSLVLNRVAVTGNFASCDGGGIDLDVGSASITNTTIAGNTMPDTGPAGGGMDIDSSQPVIFRNDTIARNTAAGAGSGIGAGLWRTPGQALTFANTIIAGNTSGGVENDCTTTGPITVSAPNLDGDSNCFTGAGAIHSASPGLGVLANNGGPTNTVGLLSGSPAIDAGLNVECPAVDQRSVARPVGSQCDLGAFEGVLSSSSPGGGSTPPPTTTTPGATGQRAAALANCKKKFTKALKNKRAHDALTPPVKHHLKKKLRKCKRSANQLPV